MRSLQQKTNKFSHFFLRLEKLRLNLGITWDQLAVKMECNRSLFFQVKRGNCGLSRRNQLKLEALEAGVNSESPISEPHAAPKNWGGPYYGTTDAAPVISWAQAGLGRAYADMGPDVPRLKTPCPDPNCYWLVLQGDSMQPIYHAGDYILCAPNLEPMPRDLVMVRQASEEVHFKRYLGKRDGRHRFESLNPNYAIMELGPEELEKIHVVWCVTRFLKGVHLAEP